MRTFLAALSILTLAAVPAVPARAQNKPAGPAPAVLGEIQSTANLSNPFHAIDPALKDLAHEAGTEFSECIAALDYLRADLASTVRRLKARNNGKIPSNQASLVALKIKRVGRQQENCVARTKEINEHFAAIMQALAGVEPNNHPGIPARRAKVAALRERFTATLKKLRLEGRSGPAAGGTAGDDKR